MCNALDALFDELPEAGDKPPASGDLPVLGLAIDLEQARQSRLTPYEAALSGVPAEEPVRPAVSRNRRMRFTWMIMAAVLAILVMIQLSEFREKPAFDLPFAQSFLVQLGLKDPPASPVFRDTKQIHLVSRELRSHDSKDNTLRLTATIVNRAAQSQPYPELEVILLDARGEEVSRSRFAPPDYLSENTAANPDMTPQAFLPLVIDLPDPGQQAVGFELNFK